MTELIGLEEIRAAHRRIAPYVLRTPLVPLDGSQVQLKAENLQAVGSFKLRGAINTLLLLGERATDGVVAHSSGNHAIAVAHAGAVLGVPVTVVMPADAPAVKIERTRALGAMVDLVGPASSERAERATALAAERGIPTVEPYDSAWILAATATIAVEILEDLDRTGPIIYVPVSGGGLAGGVAAGAKLLDPSVRIIAVEPDLAADYVASHRAGRRLALPAEDMARTAADGLRVQQVGELPWAHLQAYVDDVRTVSEEEIAAAVRQIATSARMVSEPSGAVALAAALADADAADAHGGSSAPPVAVVTGANADAAARRTSARG